MATVLSFPLFQSVGIEWHVVTHFYTISIPKSPLGLQFSFAPTEKIGLDSSWQWPGES